LSERARTSPIWLLRIVLPGARGRIVTSVAILTLMVGWFWLAGTFESDAVDVSPATALFFATILAYIVPVFHYITEQTERAFDQLVPQIDADPDALESWRRGIREKTARSHALTIGLGLVAWAAHTLLLYGTVPRIFQVVDATRIAFVFAPLLVWVSMVTAIGGLVENALLFRRLVARTRIDLLVPAPLTAFGRVAVISTLAMVGAQAAFPLLWLEADRALVTSVPGLLGTSSAMVALFVLPIMPAHRAIVAAKRAELERIGQHIARARHAIDRLEPHLVYRREIQCVSDWPFDSNIVTRLAFYLVIPPLTWLGAALLDVFVERMM
jgi:hypothetical protein